MIEVTAFSPGHITGFFQICDQSADPLLIGSRGAGVSIKRGITTKVRIEESSKASFEIRINGDATKSAKASKHVVNALFSRGGGNHHILVDHDVKVPIRSGFGSSGAGALSLALALNEAFDIGLSRVEAAQVAHIAEVKCKTGLGTVIAETFGGLEIRVKPGAPGIGKIKHIPVGKDYVVACLNFGSLSTKEVLTDERLRQRINECGSKLVDELVTQPKPCNFMEFSRNFTEYVGLTSIKMREVFREADNRGLTCSMAMLGQSVFSLAKRDATEELLKIFREYAPSEHNVFVTEIDIKGARLL